MRAITTEQDLAALALALGAERVRGWSPRESDLADGAPALPRRVADVARRQIARGLDPLGTALCQMRTPASRRPRGATYTPPPVVRAMVRWAALSRQPVARVVDPGVGSGRFLVAAGRRFTDAALVGVDIDPLAALIARGHLAAAGLASRAEIVVGDFRRLAPAPHAGRTLWIGNPPYVRHHLVDPSGKAWLTRTAAGLGLRASRLAGLHVHFLLATAVKARAGDIGVFITAAEWLDVNYGRLVRELFLGPLGGGALTFVDPAARPFPDAATTAVISCFECGARPSSVCVRRVAALDQLADLSRGRTVPRDRLERTDRWSSLTRPRRRVPAGFVQLGELCRVHRGQVTGANHVWIAGPHSVCLPASVLYPSVTRALELFDAQGRLTDQRQLRRVIDLPADLDALDRHDRRAVQCFLTLARRLGADQGYVARARNPWWSVGLREAAPILATYMARRPPAFVRNITGARHINIAHGIYPRDPLSDTALDALADHLARRVDVEAGRTYAGGLTKFEPREMERLLVPDLPALLAGPPRAGAGGRPAGGHR